MNTTNRFHHINGLLPYKPPPWKQRLRQKLIGNLLGIIYILLLASSPSNYTIKPSINTGTATSLTGPPHRPLIVLETHHTQRQTKNYSTIPPLPNNRPPHSTPPSTSNHLPYLPQPQHTKTPMVPILQTIFIPFNTNSHTPTPTPPFTSNHYLPFFNLTAPTFPPQGPQLPREPKI